MTEASKRLMQAKFIKEEFEDIYKDLESDELKKKLAGMDMKDIEKHADEEYIEKNRDQIIPTGYPSPKRIYRLIHETYEQSLEEHYYWVLNHLRDMGYPELIKITDIFTAAEHSAFFGVAQQRLGLQQDKVSQLLATIGKMVKELFQLVREIRILKERISYYADSYDEKSKSRQSAEITLKGNYIDMVEGGGKNPSSVYGMARDLQFTVLPDLFFSTHPVKARDVDTVVDKLEFNNKVKEVLKRKLRSFLEWKEHTYKELETREVFTLKYLRQHFDIIKMYMVWVRPYLRNIRRMHSEPMEQYKERSVDIVSAFEGSLIEVEFLAKALPSGNSNYFAIVVGNFMYRTRPSLNYQQEGYQRGPIHVGTTEMTLRAYGWDNKQIQNYIKMKTDEDFELLGVIDGSVKAAMEALGDELEKYLEEAGEKIFGKKKAEEKPKQSMGGPFFSIFKGFAELGGALMPAKGKSAPKKKTALEQMKTDAEIKKAAGQAAKNIWTVYKNFKKAHEMVAW
jgi:hypothetical protein